MTTHRIFSDIDTGYELNQTTGKGYWQVVAPEATRNMVINPSFERDDYGWFLPPLPNLDLKWERSADISIFGAYSVRIEGKNVVDPSRSFIYTTLDRWDYGQPLTLSAYGITLMEAINSRSLRVSIALKVGTAVVAEAISNPLKGKGRWYRVTTGLMIPDTFRSEDPNKSIEIRLYHGGGKGDILYWDAIQAEQKAYPTTFCDGDMLGLTGDITPYCWEGQPHRSASLRSATTRSGGYPINLSEDGFMMTQFQGMGLAEVGVQTQSYGLLPGSIYSQSLYNQREMILSGRVCGDQFKTLRQQFYAVEKLLTPNVGTRQGLFKLIFEQADACCDDTLEIFAAYNGGLEGDYTSLYQSEFTIRTLSPDPFFKTIGERGQRLEYANVMTIHHIIQRMGNGQWDNLRGGVANSGAVSGVELVKKVLWVNGRIVAFGNFDTGGNPGYGNGVVLNKLAQYSDEEGWLDIFDATTYVDMTDLDVRDIVAMPDGRLVFTAYDTGLLATGVWSTNLTSLSDCQQQTTQLGNFWLTDAPNTWETLAVGMNGYIYAGGSRGGIEVWNRLTWQSFMTGFDGTIHDMAFDVDGNLYVVGDFELEVILPPGSIPTFPLEVIPKFNPVETYTLKAIPTQVMTIESEFVLVADVEFDADDPVTDYDWYIVETAESFNTPNRILNHSLLTRPDRSLTEIQLTVTTASGKTLTNSFYYFRLWTTEDGKTTDSSLTQVSALSTNNTLEYNLALVTFYPQVNQLSDDDEIIQYFWSNDQTLDTSTDKEPTFDFSTLADGDDIVVTLVTTTLYGGTNTNSVTVTKDASKGIIEVADTATFNVTFYSKALPGQAANRVVLCKNGVVIAPDLSVTCMGDLPPSYGVEISEDKRAYIGARDGLYTYNGSSIQKLVGSQKITALAIHPITGEIYLGGLFGLLKWNFYYLVSAGITVRPNAVVNSISFNKCDGALAVGFKYAGGVRTSGHVQLYYPGSAEARPSFRFFGPGNIVEITNYTTHQSLYPQHTMQSGEIVDLSLAHGRVSFRSSYWGELPLSKGTNSNFFLAKDYNDFGMWIDEGTPYCTEAVAIFPVKHVSANALCVPSADVRFPIAPLPEECCPDGRTLVVGDAPDNNCYKAPCARGSIIIDPIRGGVWINTGCVPPPDDPCLECLPPQRRYVDDDPTPDVVYDCVPGTVVINPITGAVWVLAGCGEDTLLDDNGDILQDSEGECIDDDG